jgi:hypothetical protein
VGRAAAAIIEVSFAGIEEGAGSGNVFDPVHQFLDRLRGAGVGIKVYDDGLDRPAGLARYGDVSCEFRYCREAGNEYYGNSRGDVLLFVYSTYGPGSISQWGKVIDPLVCLEKAVRDAAGERKVDAWLGVVTT